MKCLVFDLDGTIADTRSEAFKVMSEYFEKRGIKISKDAKKLRTLGVREGLKKYGIPLTDMIFLARKYRKRLNKVMKEIKIFPGMRPVLKKLSRQHRLALLTSNSRKNVDIFLENNKLAGMFDFIETGNPVLGKHRRLKKAIKRHGYKKDEVMYIGDEVRDINAAKKAGIKSAAVSWGYNTASRLKREKPDFLVTRPAQLLKISKKPY